MKRKNGHWHAASRRRIGADAPRRSTRRDLLIALGAGALTVPLALPLSSLAQLAGKVWRIGILEQVSPNLNIPYMEALRAGLRELGYLEGNNLAIEYRSSDGHAERFDVLAKELLDLKIDLMVTRGTPATQAAKKATATVPIVMTVVGDPLLSVASLAHPGGNITGLSSLSTGLIGKRVELLKEIFPSLANIYVLLNPENPNLVLEWNEINDAAKAMGVRTQRLDIRKSEEITKTLEQLKLIRGSALMVLGNAILQANYKLINNLAVKRKLPSVYPSKEFAEGGGLMAYGPSLTDLYRGTAIYIDKIFKGSKPGDLPVEQPIRFELVVNLQTAKTLGLKIPQSILVRADKVIE